MAQPYQHAPLDSPDSIRLLDLLPALRWNAPVECRIRQMTFENAGDKYEALSYVWGVLEGDRPITCDGCELLITPNCHDAIVHLRRRFQVRTLWIDSICIDQRKTPDSTQERNHQVKQMGVVYQNASRVLVWLGLNTSGLTVKTHMLLKFACYGDRSDLPQPIRLATYEAMLKRTSYFRPLLASPWFVRIWTVQEFAFAKECTLIWGRIHIKWECIQYFVEKFQPIEDMLQAIPFRNLATCFIRKKLPHTPRQHRLYPEAVSSPAELRFVLSLRFQQSTLNHDKVYGVYAVLTTMGIKIPEPDYTKPAESVMEEFTWAYISSRKHLDLITAEISTDKSHTWIPEYIMASEITIHSFGTYVRGRTNDDLDYDHRASRNSKAFIARKKRPGKLVVKGKHVDFVRFRTICQATRTGWEDPFDFQKYRDFIAVCQYWCRFCTELLKKPRQTVYRTSDSLWRAVLGSILIAYNMSTEVADWIDLMLYPRCRKLSAAEVQSYSRPRNTTEAKYQPLPVDIILNYLSNAREGIGMGIITTQLRAEDFVNWAFLITGNGYIGRAYRTCQEGDQLWLLAGSANPVLLRPSGSEYRYIAPAYFHGIMRGELWPEDETELETITLV